MDEKKDVPFYAFEAVVTRSEFAIKRLIAALIVAIILLFACNVGWLIAWMQFDYTDEQTISAEQDGDGINLIGGGNIAYGTEGDNHTDAVAYTAD